MASLSSLPKHLGRYEVGAKIGGGGMAAVFIGRALDASGREQLVALKVMREELAHDRQFSLMFADEAKILARLSHPNVIRTLEYGISGDHPFIAMELLSGRTYADLWDLLAHRGEAMPLRLGAWICARIAEGLHCAHDLLDDAGQPLAVIHRDVNPSNIFLTHGGEVKLIDFGLAKARARLSRSADGVVKGKIPYLAPEQVHGEPIDRRIDIYALGTTLWETVTMRRLFKRDTDLETVRTIRDAIVPDVREARPDVPEALRAIIEKALRRNKAERHATARELGAELDAFVGDPTALAGELSALLATLFPSHDADHKHWVEQATSKREPMRTLPPPVPVPMASSSMLDDVQDGAGASAGAAGAPPPVHATEPAAREASIAVRRRPPIAVAIVIAIVVVIGLIVASR